MTWARVGVKCVCVKEARRIYEYDQGCTFAEIGQTYTVRDVGVFGGRVGIVLEEIVNPIGDVTKGFGGETGFPIHFFRPLITQADDIALIKSLLLPVKPELVRERELTTIPSD